MVGLAFMSSATVLPAFAESLGASTVLIGAIPAVMTVGWFLPPLFAAAHTERLPRKLPFVLRWTGWERVPFLVLTLVAFFLAGRAPRLSTPPASWRTSGPTRSCSCSVSSAVSRGPCTPTSAGR
jgi:hypothetical protein